MDKVSSTLITDHISVLASFSTAFGAQVGIGTLPLVWYGTEEQKQRYLPKLAGGEWIAAYSLSEATRLGRDERADTGDAERGRGPLHAERRDTVDDSRGIADLFTIFAKIDGEKFWPFWWSGVLRGSAWGFAALACLSSPISCRPRRQDSSPSKCSMLRSSAARTARHAVAEMGRCYAGKRNGFRHPIAEFQRRRPSMLRAYRTRRGCRTRQRGAGYRGVRGSTS